MNPKISFKNKGFSAKLVYLAVIFCFAFKAGAAPLPQGGAYGLPYPNQFVPLSKAYSYPVLKGIKINPDDPFKLEFIIDAENKEGIDKQELSYLVKYFLAALTLPEEELWVNLSPYEKDRIIPQDLGLTDLGKDMLGQDYILKQLVSSITHPESRSGKKYWNKIYEEISKLTGNSQIPIDTFNKVWIVPESAEVYENGNVALITETKLKAMMEEDMQASGYKIQAIKDKTIHKTVSEAMRETILPEIEKDINYGENFAKLRQMYYSLILAVWFKKKLKDSIYQYYINQGKIQGIDLKDKDVKENIYNLYTESFKKGVYDYIKDSYEPGLKKNVKRRYYSGGIKFNAVSSSIKINNLPVISAIKKVFSYAKINLSIFGTKKSDSRIDENILEKMQQLSHISQLEQEPFKFIKDGIDFLRENFEIPSDIELVVGGGVVRDLLLGLSINNPDPVMAIKDLDIILTSQTKTLQELREFREHLLVQARKKDILIYANCLKYTSNNQDIILDIGRMTLDRKGRFVSPNGLLAEKISVNTLGIAIKGDKINFIYDEQALRDIREGKIELLEADGKKLLNNAGISPYSIFKALILKYQLRFELKETCKKIIEEYDYTSLFDEIIPEQNLTFRQVLEGRLTRFAREKILERIAGRENKEWVIFYNYNIEGLDGLILTLYKKSQNPKLVTKDLKNLLKLDNDDQLYKTLSIIERYTLYYKSKKKLIATSSSIENTKGGIDWNPDNIGLKTASSSLQFNLPLETIQEFQSSGGLTFEIAEIKQKVEIDKILKH